MEEGHAEHHEHVEHHQFHDIHNKKRMNKKNLLIFGGLIILVIAAVILLLIAFKPTQSLDKYNVTYTLELANGSSILTGNSIFNKDSFSSTLGLNSTTIDSEIESLSIGQEKIITLSADDAFGAYDPALNTSIDRTTKSERINYQNRIQTIPLDTFTQAFNEQPIVGKVYTLSSDFWTEYKVISSDGTNVKLEIETAVGKTISASIFSYDIIALNDTTITLKLQGNNTVVPNGQINLEYSFDDTYIYTKITPTATELDMGDGTTAKILAVTNDKIYYDSNGPYAGQNITLKLKLENKFTEKIASSSQGHIAGAPTMQAFIMSHCPYGTQMVKGLLPVMEKFKGKANIEIRFVSYTMHGAQEDLDNNRLLCIREEQNAKLISFLDCFVTNTGSEADSQKCITQVGIDKSKLDSCVSSRASEYMKADTELNTQYGVQGSPTVIIDGKEANLYPRDPATVAKAICDAFTSNKPSECNSLSSFSTTNPSAGFGTGASTSSGGSCS